MVQPIQRADETVGAVSDGALQAEAESRSRGGQAGRTLDCCQQWQWKQSRAMVECSAALGLRSHCRPEPGLPCCFFLADALLAPAGLSSSAGARFFFARLPPLPLPAFAPGAEAAVALCASEAHLRTLE